ncbi:hypothetical protein LTR56_016791 [Elasticomyces elasticus]|nr:hypothetical protein LTR22_021770 [Elasticomyces elasticus]KAK3631558.1 hypothetical protein LTR56_016791 [Elasticomyces elasticus]KAK4909398.1 hypothetical protein LTR49_021799 [Elasticomyces elasticus]KAK5749354.1 hypothetical protein LTS12_020609 [Elasticomyces elasticus]
MDEHIVDWVSDCGEPGLEELKHFIRRCWQMKSRHGTFLHQEAHGILDTRRQNLVPLFKLTVELRLKIYALVLELPTDSTEPPWHSAVQGRSSRRPGLKDTQIRLDNLAASLFGVDWGGQTEIPGLLGAFPPLLRLNHQVSAEALAPYLRFTRFTTSLEFTTLEVCGLRAFAAEVRTLKCQSPVQLEIEWLWPTQPSVQTLVTYANLFVVSESGSNAFGDQLHITHKPARTTLMRLLADLLVVLEGLGNTKDAHMAGPDHRNLAYELGEICEICQDCMLYWILQDEGPDGCQEVKEFCRDIFRLELHAHTDPQVVSLDLPYLPSTQTQPIHSSPDQVPDQVAEAREEAHDAQIQGHPQQAEEATPINALDITLNINHEQASTGLAPVANTNRALAFRPGANSNIDQAMSTVPPVDGPADVPDLIEDSADAIFAGTSGPRRPLKHPEWFDMGCAFPFEEGKGKGRKW